MHSTHQFFLTKRSLYLLVLDSRLTQEENRVEYWLKIIQSFGGESPVLIVGNKIDQHPLDIDRTGLQKKYSNIVGILETSAATGAGIEELKAAITEQVNNLPHVRDLLPETWFTVKTKLEELGKQSNFITHDKYIELCAENEVSDETSQRTLIGFIHDLGVVLHFQDDPRLEALGILNPQWVTNGVYKILNSHTLFQNKGVLTTAMLDEILNQPEYPRGKRLFIVDMMKKFELCYDIEPDKTFLVPDLLPKDEPAELKFNGVPAFEYAYPVLPSSVITRFIVRMNQKIDDGLVWRTGVVLKIGENKALVKADIEDRKITIAIDGVEYSRRDALSAIRYELCEIHNSIKGLNPQQRVPVPNAPLAEPLKYDYLLKLERSGQEFLPVENGNDLITVNIRQMLSAIETEAQRKEQGNVINNYYTASDGGIVVGRDLSGNLISGNNNKIIQDSYNKIQSADIDPELKQTLKSLTEAITTAIQSFPEERTAKVVKNFERLADEVIQPEPDKQWYSVSIEGLIKAAENLDKLGIPVISLSRKVLSLLMGEVVK
jgi:internalin A